MAEHRIPRAAAALLLVAGAAVFPQHALAHFASTGAGFTAGLAHPMLGLDHVLAMLAVGMWSSQLGRPAIWVLPVAFVAVMTVGGSLAASGAVLPAGELGVALSVIVLGAMIAFDRRLALPAALAVVSVFALAHGHAHGSALPAHAGLLSYGAGFALATGLIHLAGVGIGLLTAAPVGVRLLRAGGAAIALIGVYVSLHVLPFA